MLTTYKLCIESATNSREKGTYAMFYAQSNKSWVIASWKEAEFILAGAA